MVFTISHLQEFDALPWDSGGGLTTIEMVALSKIHRTKIHGKGRETAHGLQIVLYSHILHCFLSWRLLRHHPPKSIVKQKAARQQQRTSYKSLQIGVYIA